MLFSIVEYCSSPNHSALFFFTIALRQLRCPLRRVPASEHIFCMVTHTSSVLKSVLVFCFGSNTIVLKVTQCFSCSCSCAILRRRCPPCRVPAPEQNFSIVALTSSVFKSVSACLLCTIVSSSWSWEPTWCVSASSNTIVLQTTQRFVFSCFIALPPLRCPLRRFPHGCPY